MEHKHPYLSDSQCITRLIEEYKLHRSLVVAYDFDNTVFDYHGQGHDYTEVIELLRECRQCGLMLIVFTAEQDNDKVRNWLTEHDVPFDVINENPPFFKSKSRKIYFNILLDDRAGLRSAFNQLTCVIEYIKGETN